MYLQVKVLENGTKNVFSDEQTRRKISLALLDLKMRT